MARAAQLTQPLPLDDQLEVLCRGVLKLARTRFRETQRMLAQQVDLQSMIDEKNSELQREKECMRLLCAKFRFSTLVMGELANTMAAAATWGLVRAAPRTKPLEDPNFHLKVHYLKKPVIMDDKRGVVFERCESSAMAKNRRKREARAAKRTRAQLDEAASASPKEDTMKEDVCEEASPVSTTPSSSWSPSGSGGGPPSKRPRTSLAREDVCDEFVCVAAFFDRDGVSPTLDPSSGSDDGAHSDARAVDRASDPSGAVLAERGLEPRIADGGPGGKKPSGWRARSRVSSPSSM